MLQKAMQQTAEKSIGLQPLVTQLSDAIQAAQLNPQLTKEGDAFSFSFVCFLSPFVCILSSLMHCGDCKRLDTRRGASRTAMKVWH